MKLRRHDMGRDTAGMEPSGPTCAPRDGAARADRDRQHAKQCDERLGAAARRRRAKKFGRLRTSPSHDELTLTSEDGTLSIRLKRIDDCVHMERSRRRARSSAVVQVSDFGDESSFVRWCESDRLRFNYPLLFANLRRNGRALFSRA